MNEIMAIEAAQMKSDPGNFKIGDTVKVHFKIIEGKNERIQVYEGLVIAMKNSGLGKTFTVRKISYGVSVERVFPIHSPKVVNVEVMRRGKVRRAKLYYIRDKIGKGAKIKELIIKKSDRKQAPKAAVAAAASVEAAPGAEAAAAEQQSAGEQAQG
ncbi:MAG: 50S ribosomal protein L19 [Spirochaetes bacterium]|nr:50S ribosomal protein L19 [Spirochaetota bacterium]